MNKGDINRKKAQDYAVYLSENFDHVLLSWATGVGKTLAAIKIIDNNISKSFETRGDWDRWYIVVAEKQHITNWEEDIRKHGYNRLLDLGYVSIFCYQSLHKYANNTANIVLDECHSVTDLKEEVIRQINPKLMISLSATVERYKARILNGIRPYKEYKIDIDKAIDAEILPHPTIVKVEVDMSTQVGSNYLSYNTKIAEVESALGMYKNRILMGDNNVTNERVKQQEDKLNRLKLKRKEFLALCKSAVAHDILLNLVKDKKKTIAFAGAKDQAVLFGNPILSEMSDKNNERTIERFNKGEILNISVLKMLRQGTNLNGVQAGIITQLDSKQLSFIQMCGRIFRSAEPLVFVLVMKNTIDEVYWNNAVRGIKPDYIKTYQQYLADGKK